MTAGRAVIVEADGGSRGNPGPAGYGALVRDAATGELLAERQDGLGVTTNNVAEYSGLLAGLRAAAELNASTVDVRMDSKLVVEQMSGRWKIKNAALRPLAEQAAELAAGFERVGYEWIPRARNADADRLANQAMDAQAEGRRADRSATSVSGAAPVPASAPVSDVEPVLGAAPVRNMETVPISESVADSGSVPRAGSVPEVGSVPISAPISGPAPIPDSVPVPDPVPVTAWTGAKGTPTRFLLLRHGQTEMSVQRRYSGRGDVPLTETGLAQAAAAAGRLAALNGLGKFGGLNADTPIVCSPLTRARQTAQAVADRLGGRVRTHQGLLETDFGRWEGATFAEAAERDPELHQRWLRDSSVPPPDGESFDQVHRRVRAVRDELIAEHNGGTVLLVSHVTPIKTLLQMGLDAGPALLFRLHLDLASLSIVEFYPDGHASVRLVNETAYLD